MQPESIWAPALSALAMIIGAIFARRKSKEDTNISVVAQAVGAWQELAEFHKKHWEECEAKYDALEKKTEGQHEDLLNLKFEVLSLKLHINGKKSLDEQSSKEQ